jgi:hypothetical protein
MSNDRFGCSTCVTRFQVRLFPNRSLFRIPSA